MNNSEDPPEFMKEDAELYLTTSVIEATEHGRMNFSIYKTDVPFYSFTYLGRPIDRGETFIKTIRELNETKAFLRS